MRKEISVKKTMFPILFLSILLMAFAFLLQSGSTMRGPKPTGGVLDLSGWDAKRGYLSLAGEWAFYWERLYTAQDFRAGRADGGQVVHTPATWNTYQESGMSLPSFGYATYRLRVSGADPAQRLSIRVDTLSTSYRLFIDGREYASNGTVGTQAETARPDYRPTVLQFTPPARAFDLIVQVANFTYARGGMWYSIAMGTDAQMERLNDTVLCKDALLIGSLLIMALYYASFYMLLQRDRSCKYFMLLCLVFILRTALDGGKLLSRSLPELPFGVLIFLTYATLYWIPVILFLLVDSLFPNRLSPVCRRVFVLYGASATLLTAMLPIHVYTACLTAIEIIGFVILAGSMRIIYAAYRSGEKNAVPILAASVVVFVAGAHDVLYQASIIHHSFGELASIGIFLLIYTFSFILASRLSDAYEHAKQLSEQLEIALQKEKAAGEELVQTELAFLKAQIRPHFLYNSLSVIAALTLDDPQRAKGLLYDLSDYLRGSFRFECYNGLVSLNEEIETLKAYLSIEKARFQSKLRVEYDIDEAVCVQIPLLTIQPIVENAVRHGIFKKPNGGRIVLRVYAEDGFAVISVSDDGVGISPQTLDTMTHEQGSARGVGLKNINRRLELFYGQGLEIQSVEGAGTQVTLRIPLEGRRPNASDDRG